MYQGNDDFERTYFNIREIIERTGSGSMLQEDLADAIDHGVLVTKTVRLLCEFSGFSEEFKDMMLTAAGLHDIGKLQLGQVLYGRDKSAMKPESIISLSKSQNLYIKNFSSLDNSLTSSFRCNSLIK